MTDEKFRAAKDCAQTEYKHTEIPPAVASFFSEVKSFKSEVKQFLQHQEERLNMLNQKTITARRPTLSVSAETELPHKKAFGAYLRSGDDDGLRGLVVESKGMNTTVNADGGYLVEPQTNDMIQEVMRSATSLRSISKIVQVQSGTYDIIVDRSDAGAGWSSETATVSETVSPKIDRISIPVHELSALPKISQRLLDDSAFDVETWLAGKIAEKFSRSENTAFVSGDGEDKPKGFLNHTKVADRSWEWGKIGYVVTGAEGDFANTNPADSIVDLVYALDAGYRMNATFVMNSKTAGAVRKMKDSDGRFLWSDGLAHGEPPRLMGYAVLISEDMPDIANNSFSIAFGAFSDGYTIVERPDLRIMRDPFSAKPNVLFYATKRVGGDVSDFAAIKLLKFASS